MKNEKKQELVERVRKRGVEPDVAELIAGLSQALDRKPLGLCREVLRQMTVIACTRIWEKAGLLHPTNVIEMRDMLNEGIAGLIEETEKYLRDRWLKELDKQ